LDELELIAKKCSIFSINKFNLLSFMLKNYIGKNQQSITAAVKEKIAAHGYIYHDANIFILTNLSYLGYCYNPVSFYYCYNATGDELEYILAEINNTPWDERHTYVFKCDSDKKNYNFEFDKQFHISPFMPMEQNYKWLFNQPDNNLNIVMQTFEKQALCFAATMSLKRLELNTKNIWISFFKFPLITQKIIFSIYWQALLLWLKRCKFYSHPRSINLPYAHFFHCHKLHPAYIA
jgi:DUF1365 family protein